MPSSQVPVDRSVVQRAIDEVISLVSRYDPIELIGPIACLREMSIGGEDPSEREWQSDTELLLSIAAALPSSPRARPDLQALNEADRALRKLSQLVTMFFATQSSEPRSLLRFNTLLNHLCVRGDSYLTIAHEIDGGLFDGLGAEARRAVGFHYQDLFAFLLRAKAHIEMTFSLTAAESGDSVTKADVKWMLGASRRAYLIPIETTLDQRIADAISIRYGDNADFISGDDQWRGWPTNPSLIHMRPLLATEEGYFLFPLSHALRSAGAIMERQLASRSPPLHKRFLRQRDRYLERESARELVGIFGDGAVHTNLRYGANREFQADGVISCGDCLVLLEAKAGSFTPSARRGAPKRLARDLRRLLSEPLEQATRTLNYVRSQEVSTLHRDGSPVTLRRSDYDQTFALVVTLANLGHLTANLHHVIESQILPDGASPFVISLGDLKIATRILERPSVFMHYVKCRLRALEAGICAGDEMDYLGAYCDSALPLLANAPSTGPTIFLGTYTEALDAFFLADQVGESAVKPRPPMPALFEQVIDDLERTGTRDSLACAIALLDLTDEERRDVRACVNRAERRALKTMAVETVTLLSRDRGLAVSMSAFRRDPTQHDMTAIASEIVRRRGRRTTVSLGWRVPFGSHQSTRAVMTRSGPLGE